MSAASGAATPKWQPPRITEATFLAFDVEDDSIGKKILEQFCLEQPVVWDALTISRGHTKGHIAMAWACESHYEPLPSIWEEDDAKLLERMLVFYPRTDPKDILDATVNGGRFWRGSNRHVVGMDIDSKRHPAVVADNSAMPFRAESFDVVVYDPPHIPNQGKDNQKDFNTRFGLVERSPKEHGHTFTHTYPPFAREAYAVLKPEGILLCKIADYIHHHQYQWAHVEFIQAARHVGFRACDCIIKVRKGPIIDPKWKVAHHSRRQHAYWLIFRKSKKCE